MCRVCTRGIEIKISHKQKNEAKGGGGSEEGVVKPAKNGYYIPLFRILYVFAKSQSDPVRTLKCKRRGKKPYSYHVWSTSFREASAFYQGKIAEHRATVAPHKRENNALLPCVSCDCYYNDNKNKKRPKTPPRQSATYYINTTNATQTCCGAKHLQSFRRLETKRNTRILIASSSLPSTKSQQVRDPTNKSPPSLIARKSKSYSSIGEHAQGIYPGLGEREGVRQAESEGGRALVAHQS